MKVAFDENIPILLVEMFQALEGKTPAMGCEVVSSRDFRPAHEQGDANWIHRFSAAGGKVLITGDARMRTLAHERAAIAQTGLVAYFFGPPWNNTPYTEKAAVLLKQWARIITHAHTAARGSCWQVPCSFGDEEFEDVSAAPENITATKVKKKPPKRTKKKPAKAKAKAKTKAKPPETS